MFFVKIESLSIVIEKSYYYNDPIDYNEKSKRKQTRGLVAFFFL